MYISESSHIMIYQSIILIDELYYVCSLVKLVKLQIIDCILCFFYRSFIRNALRIVKFLCNIWIYMCVDVKVRLLKHSCHIVFIQTSIAMCPVCVIKMWLRYRRSVIYIHFYRDQIFFNSIFEIGIFFDSTSFYYWNFVFLKLILSYYNCIICLIEFF